MKCLASGTLEDINPGINIIKCVTHIEMCHGLSGCWQIPVSMFFCIEFINKSVR